MGFLKRVFFVLNLTMDLETVLIFCLLRAFVDRFEIRYTPANW